MAPMELPFLYQTRTILHFRRSFATSSSQCLRRRPLSRSGPSMSCRSASPTTSQNFFQEKADTWTPVPGKPTKCSTITEREKRAFDKIFNDIATEKSGIRKKEVVRNNDADTDHENILAIFSNSIKDYHAEQRKKTAAVVGLGADAPRGKDEDFISRYPKPLQKAARRATRASLREQIHQNGDFNGLTPHDPYSEPST